MSKFAEFWIVSAVVMGLAHTLTREKIFEPLRAALGGKETWLGYLVSCPYCASHWFAFVLVPITGVRFVPIAFEWTPLTELLSWFLSSILIVVGAAFLRVGFYFVDESQGLVRRRSQDQDSASDT